MTSSTESAASTTALPDSNTRPRHWHLSRWTWGALALVPLFVWGGYQGWWWFQTRQFRERCESGRKAEDWRYERKAAQEWTAWDPSAGAAWWYAAEAAQELDDMEELARCLGNVPASDPKVLFAVVEKANLEWTTLNRPLEALKTSARVLAINPRVIEIQSRVISFYAMNLQRAPMLKSIRAAIDVGAEPKESYPYLIMADLLSFSNGEKLNGQWLASSPDELRLKVGLAVHMALNIAKNVDVLRTPDAITREQEAMQQLQWFLDQLPHDSVLLTFLMYRAYQADDVKRMGELLELVDEASADDHMVWVFRCRYHVAFDDFKAAEEAVQEALRLHSLSPLAHHEYANLLRKMQRPQTEIAEQQKLAAAGRELRTQLLSAPNVLEISPALLQQIALYSEQCGDEQVAKALSRRLQPRSFSIPASTNRL